MVDWTTRKLLPHKPEYRSTVKLPIEYHTEATCPEFDKFLAQVLPPDCVEFVWEIIGYAMYSGNPLHIVARFGVVAHNGRALTRGSAGCSPCSTPPG